MELVFGTLNLEKGRKLHFFFHFRSFTLLLFCFYFLSLLVLYNDVTIALNNNVTTAHVPGYGHVPTYTETTRVYGHGNRHRHGHVFWVLAYLAH